MTQRFAIFLAILSLTIFSCSKGNDNFSNQSNSKIDDSNNDFVEMEDSEKVEIAAEEIKPVETFSNGVVLYDNASLWLFGRDEKMHSVLKTPKNTILPTVYYDNILDTKNSATEKSDTERTYLHVVYDSIDFWILESLIAPNSSPAVIIEKTKLYIEESNQQTNDTTESDSESETKNENQKFEIKPTSTFLKFGTAIAKSNEKKTADNRTFEKIYYFDKNSDSVVSAYIEAGKASSKNDDVMVADIVEKLKVTTRAVPRNELFAKAEKYNPSASVKRELENQKVEKISYDYQEVLESMTRTSRYRVNLDELNTVDQSKDPFQ